ncbi:hypothetical protein SASPL_129825 [Salvia splendens]|uniref:Uncharacterized protein n=1 Tax=Salvia splendens TaxID=180675 RepID=A0A8X8XDE9_SALSN|nr:hypothetical protein SASPL_129825 [Salvia splendens]
MTGSGSNGSPLTDGTSDFPSSRTVKCERSRRCWSPHEETILITTLKELVTTRCKSDNGFRSGYLTKGGIRKRSCRGSSVNRPWGDSVTKIYGAKAVPNEDSGTYDHMTFEELFLEVLPDGILPEMIGESPSTLERATTKVPQKVIKKRKVDDKMDGFLNLMSCIHEDTNECLKEISSRIEYEFDLSTKRTEVFQQLKGIPGLTMKQKFYVSKKFVKEPELMDLFRGLDEVARLAFVMDLLENNGLI